MQISKQATGKGQMSKEEIIDIKDKLCLDSYKERNFYIIGNPISKSPSPAFHNKVFKLFGLHEVYKRYETDNLDSAVYIINKEETFGWSVTIPLKEELFEKYKEFASPDAKFIKAINTIMKINGKITVYNTDWVAIYNYLSKLLPKVKERTHKILIIGAGGTSLAAIYAVLRHEWVPIIHSRKKSILKSIKFMKKVWIDNEAPQYWHDLLLFQKVNDFCEFTQHINEESVDDVNALTETILQRDSVGLGVDAIISWVPGVSGYSIPDEVCDVLMNGKDRNVIVYDASYLPKKTSILTQAKERNCQIVQGIEMLISQAWEQSKIFTGRQITSKCKRLEVEREVYKFYDQL